MERASKTVSSAGGDVVDDNQERGKAASSIGSQSITSVASQESIYETMRRTRMLEPRSSNRRITKNAQFVNVLKECMLNHRWVEAGQVMKAICLEPMQMEDIIWKCGRHIMYNHPKSTQGIVSAFSLKLQRLLNQQGRLEKSVEHAFYLLSKGDLQEAYMTLREAPDLRKGLNVTKRHETEDRWETLAFLYSGLIKYAMWLESKAECSNESEYTDIQFGSQDSLAIERHADDATRSFEFLTDTAGIWDVFITKHCEILECHEKLGDASEVLHKYKDNNPKNPNAHKYLYDYLKRHNAHPNELVTVLKDLLHLVPSDALALDMCELIQNSADNASLALPFLFDMLDYACWQDDIRPWEKLADLLITVVKDNDSDGLKITKECWDSRSKWWPSYHFRSCHVRTDTEQDRNVLDCKAAIATLLPAANTSTGNPFRKCAKRALKHTGANRRLKKAIKLTKDN